LYEKYKKKKKRRDREIEREKVEENKKVENFYTNVSGNNICHKDFSCQFGVGKKNLPQCREIR